MLLIVFTLEMQQYALRLGVVDKVIRAVEISPLPQAPEIVQGVINVRGRIMPVINVRQRFHLPERELALSDQFIIAHTARRPVCLVADSIVAVSEYPEQSMAGPESILPGMEYVEGVVKLDNGLLLIHDLDSFLSLDEEVCLTQALASA